ncbi:hypothetical protein AB0Y29_22950, partial [Enterobacter hormaechei]|uniref:hypothetical protein n=1 Tax=Enterobacter hormaechei TaxID=158836 RepID=UPI003F24E255
FHDLLYLTTNYLSLPPGEDRGDSSSGKGEDRGDSSSGKGEELSVINSPCQSGVSTIYSTCNIPVFHLMILRISKIPRFPRH